MSIYNVANNYYDKDKKLLIDISTENVLYAYVDMKLRLEKKVENSNITKELVDSVWEEINSIFL